MRGCRHRLAGCRPVSETHCGLLGSGIRATRGKGPAPDSTPERAANQECKKIRWQPMSNTPVCFWRSAVKGGGRNVSACRRVGVSACGPKRRPGLGRAFSPSGRRRPQDETFSHGAHGGLIRFCSIARYWFLSTLFQICRS